MTSIYRHDSQALMRGYIGPKASQLERQTIPYSNNDTAGYIPTVLLNQRELRKPVEQLVQTREIDLKLLEDLQDDIENHIEYRIQIMYQKFCLLWKTESVFSKDVRADFQFGKGAKGFCAAHSDTLPSLRTYDESENEVIFACGTDFYKFWNVTVFLPVVNNVDSALDCHSKKIGTEQSIRDLSIELLNAVSAGKYTPDEGLAQFLEHLKNRITILQGYSKTTDEQRFVLERYQAVVEEYQQIAEEPETLHTLGFVQSNTDEEFYEETQVQMHEILRGQLDDLAPKTYEEVEYSEEDFKLHKEAIDEKIALITTTHFKQAEQFANQCLEQPHIRDMALDYLVNVGDNLEEHLVLIEKIKTTASILNYPGSKKGKNKITLPDELFEFHQAVIKQIRDSNYESEKYQPKRVNLIMLRILSEMCHNPIVNIHLEVAE